MQQDFPNWRKGKKEGRKEGRKERKIKGGAGL
jgi:hypothetical protein